MHLSKTFLFYTQNYADKVPPSKNTPVILPVFFFAEISIYRG